jgi:CRISPR-associated protein Csa3
VIPKYKDDDEEIGIESIIDLPILPVTPLKKEQIDIITTIGDGVSSLDELVFRMNQCMKKTSEEFPKERSRLSYHIKNFEMMGLIVKEKSGKNVGIRVTALGEMLG